MQVMTVEKIVKRIDSLKQELKELAAKRSTYSHVEDYEYDVWVAQAKLEYWQGLLSSG